MVNRSDSGTTGAPNPFSFSSQVRIMQIGSTPLPLYSDIGISDRSLYDWTSQNLLQPNSADRKIEVLRLTLEQYLINNSRQILAFQFGL